MVDDHRERENKKKGKGKYREHASMEKATMTERKGKFGSPEKRGEGGEWEARSGRVFQQKERRQKKTSSMLSQPKQGEKRREKREGGRSRRSSAAKNKKGRNALFPAGIQGGRSTRKGR